MGPPLKAAENDKIAEALDVRLLSSMGPPLKAAENSLVEYVRFINPTYSSMGPPLKAAENTTY